MKVQITIIYLNPSLVSLLPSLSDSYRGCSTFYLPPRCHGVPRNTFVSAKTQIEFSSRMLQHPQVHHSCFSKRIVNQGASFPLQTSCQSLSIFRIHAVSNFTLFLLQLSWNLLLLALFAFPIIDLLDDSVAVFSGSTACPICSLILKTHLL